MNSPSQTKRGHHSNFEHPPDPFFVVKKLNQIKDQKPFLKKKFLINKRISLILLCLVVRSLE
jgi:hypothetical protein